MKRDRNMQKTHTKVYSSQALGGLSTVSILSPFPAHVADALSQSAGVSLMS